MAALSSMGKLFGETTTTTTTKAKTSPPVRVLETKSTPPPHTQTPTTASTPASKTPPVVADSKKMVVHSTPSIAAEPIVAKSRKVRDAPLIPLLETAISAYARYGEHDWVSTMTNMMYMTTSTVSGFEVLQCSNHQAWNVARSCETWLEQQAPAVQLAFCDAALTVSAAHPTVTNLALFVSYICGQFNVTQVSNASNVSTSLIEDALVAYRKYGETNWAAMIDTMLLIATDTQQGFVRTLCCPNTLFSMSQAWCAAVKCETWLSTQETAAKILFRQAAQLVAANHTDIVPLQDFVQHLLVYLPAA